MMNSRKACYAASLFLCTAALGGLPSFAYAQANAPIKIGFIASMTGTAATAGFNGIVGVNMAVKEINARGGVLGRQLAVVSADDQSDPTAAVNEARRLVQREKVDVIAGPIASQLTMAAAPVFTEGKVAQISISGAAAITTQVAPYHFSLLPSSEAQADAIANYIATTLKAKSVATIHDSGAQARSIIEAIKANFAKRGIPITGEEEYSLATTDMTPQLLTLRRGNPEAMVLIAGTGTDTGYVVKNLADLNWNIKVVGNISVVVQPAVTIKVAGPDAFKNTAGINYKSLTYCSTDAVGSSDYAKFAVRLKAEVGDKFPQYSPTVVSYIYDIVNVFKAAIEATKTTDGPTLTAWLEQSAASVKVMTGDLNASKTSHFLVGPSALAMVENPDKLRSDGLQKRVGC